MADDNFNSEWASAVRCGSFCPSAPCYSRAENIRVMPIVVPELKLRNVERHVFGADLVEAADNAALEDRPETLNRIRVDCADNVLLGAVVDRPVREVDPQVVIGRVFVGGDQADVAGNNLADESIGGVFGDAAQHPSDNVALARNL